jgi:hypothetical protein
MSKYDLPGALSTQIAGAGKICLLRLGAENIFVINRTTRRESMAASKNEVEEPEKPASIEKDTLQDMLSTLKSA